MDKELKTLSSIAKSLGKFPKGIETYFNRLNISPIIRDDKKYYKQTDIPKLLDYIESMKKPDEYKYSIYDIKNIVHKEYNSIKRAMKYLNIKGFIDIHNKLYLNKKEMDDIITFIEKYTSKELQQILFKDTITKKYGVDNPMKSEKVKHNFKFDRSNEIKYNLEKELNRSLISTKDLCNKFNRDKTTIAKIYDLLNINIFEKEGYYYIDSTDFSTIKNYFETTALSGISYSEKEVVSFIHSLDSTLIIEENNRDIISPKELDIYIPEKKLAIEFDGLYWHNELHLDNRYHYNKTKACREKGIDLIHIFEDDWKLRKDIVKSMIASRLGIYKEKYMARKLVVKEIDKDSAKIFFNTSHLQGFARGDLYLALTDSDNNVVQCITINYKGFHDGNTELTRMATKLNTQVAGGFSKLMKHLINDYNIKSVTSYIYNAWFNGKGYLNSGFKVVKENPPSYYYIYNEERVHKSKFRRNKIESLYNKGELSYWNKDESEHENMLKNNIFRIYDCGTTKVIYTK